MIDESLIKFMEEHMYDESFDEVKSLIDNLQTDIAIHLECIGYDRRMYETYLDLTYMKRAINIMQHQRVYLFSKAGF